MRMMMVMMMVVVMMMMMMMRGVFAAPFLCRHRPRKRATQ